MHNQIQHLRRVWILLILRATRLCGFSTVSSKTFHRLTLFANSLAPTNHIDAETAKVLKTDYGPYFPDYQSELDRLVGLQLIDAVDLEWESEDGRFSSKYRISDEGMIFLKTAIEKLTLIAQSERAVSETISAFTEYQIDKEKDSTSVDANYGQDTVQAGELVDYGEWLDAHNYAHEAAEFMAITWQAGQTFDLENQLIQLELKNSAEDEFEEVEECDPASGHINRAAVYLYAQYISSKLGNLLATNGHSIVQ